MKTPTSSLLSGKMNCKEKMSKNFCKLLLLSPCLFSLGSCSNNEQVKFKNIFEWVDNVKVESLESISVEKGWIGTAPQNTIISQKSTQNHEYFAKFVSWLNDSILTETTYDIVGGSYIEITFNLNDESNAKIRVNNGSISSDKKFYKFDLEIPEIVE